MFWPLKSMDIGFFEISFKNLQSFPGIFIQNLCIVSNVAPPQVSTAQNPISSMSSATGIMSSVFPLVEKSDWMVPSLRLRSIIFTGFEDAGLFFS